MSVIFIGTIYPPGSVDRLRELGSVIEYASDTFEKSLLQGLFEQVPDLKVITTPVVSSYPRVQQKKFEGYEFKLPFSKQTHYCVGFSNVSYKKTLSKVLHIKRAIENALDEGDDNIIIIYAVHSPFLMSLCGIDKKRYKSCLIVPDLPEFMSDNSSILYKIAKKLDKLFINYSLKSIDSFVLFSPHMKEYLPVKSKPWIHMEGIYNTQTVPIVREEKYKEKVILYTGNLQKRMGIKYLLEAFSMIPNTDYRLWIRGNGTCLNDVKEAAKKDSRIQYIEHLSKDELLKLQRRATVLINPVFPSQTFTRYFFPSKTMEYMASGTPTIMYKLDCLPKEYYPYLYFFEDESVGGIRDKILEICSKSQFELDTFGKAASEFIIKEKNELKQSKKVVDFLQRFLLKD